MSQKITKKQPIVSLDFDDTLVQTPSFPEFIPTPLPGCKEVLGWLRDKDCKFILLTQRDDQHVYNPILHRAVWKKDGNDKRKTVLQEAIDFIENNLEIELFGVNENPTQKAWSASRKVYSDIIIDDKCAMIPTDENGCVDWIKLGEYFKTIFP